MSFRTRFAPLFTAVLAAVLLAGCGSDSTDDEPTGAATTVGCAAEDLSTLKRGVLTVATDSPAFPPYFEGDDPTNGRGFESAIAYAIADRLGFDRSSVEWISVPFEDSFSPGPKNFDFDLNQISITPAREKNVDFSTPYYRASQGVLIAGDSDLEGIVSLEELNEATIGVQRNTTSLDAVEDEIDPATDPKVFDSSEDVVSALERGRVDAIVVDLPQAISLRDTEVPGSSVVGQFDAPGGDEWGAVLAEDSELTECVNAAVQELEDEGTLEELTRRWMSGAAEAPELR